MSPHPRRHGISKFLSVIIALAVLAAGGGLLYRYEMPRGETGNQYSFAATIAGVNGEFREPFGVAISSGEIYVSDGDAGKILKLGTGAPVVFADGLGTPSAIAFDKAGNLIVADSGSHSIRSISAGGRVSTIVGQDGRSGFADGPAASAMFAGPTGVAVGGDGSIFIADTYNDRIRVIRNGSVSTLAGGSTGYSDGAGADARFNTPTGVAVWHDKVLVADMGNRRIRVIEPDGRVWTLAGDGNFETRDGLPAEASFAQPTSVAVGPEGEIFVTDANSVREIAGGIVPVVRTVSASQRGLSDSRSSGARFSRPSCLAFAGDGGLIVADSDNRLIRELSDNTSLHHITPDEIAALTGTAEQFRALQPARWPYDPPETKRDIAGTLGELRGEIPEIKDPAHFHNGLDIAGSYGETARFVRTEKVLRPIAAENFGTLREFIRMPTMGYIHIRLGRDVSGVPFDDPRFRFERDATGKMTSVRVPRGSLFKAGEAIGTLNQMNHVHLIAGRAGSEMNALNALDLPGYTDTRPPTIESVGLLDENWQPFETAASNSRIKLTGKVRIIVRAFDQVDGNSERRRLGVYKIGYQVLNADLSPVGDIRWGITFDLMPPSSALKFVYGPGSRAGATGETIFNYIASNAVEGNKYGEAFLDTATLAAGNYVLRGLAADQAGNISQKDIMFEVIK